MIFNFRCDLSVYYIANYIASLLSVIFGYNMMSHMYTFACIEKGLGITHAHTSQTKTISKIQVCIYVAIATTYEDIYL